MEALSVYDPDEKPKREKKEKVELRAGDTCPTCKRKIEKAITRDDIRSVIQVYKMVTGWDKDNAAWDRMYFRRYVGKVKDLIEFMDGDWAMAADAVQDIAEKMKDLGRTFTFETIVTHSASWKKDYQERNHGTRNI